MIPLRCMIDKSRQKIPMMDRLPNPRKVCWTPQREVGVKEASMSTVCVLAIDVSFWEDMQNISQNI